MHAGKIATSETLQRLRDFLIMRGDKGATSYELTVALELVAVATWVSALRHNGHVIECKCEGKSASGARVYRYRLVA